MSARARLLLSLAAMTAAAVVTPAWADPVVPKEPSAGVAGAQIWSTDQFVMHSDIVGRDFLIQVGKPLLPQAGRSPAVYVLDGNSTFGMVADMLADDGSHGDTTPAYVIGVGYPSQQFQDWYTTRVRDLTHVALTPEQLTAVVGVNRATPSGEGARFQRFLTQELRPLIEARYPVDPARAILAGHSLAGLFATHVLLNDPKIFDGYIIGSPSLWADRGLLAKASAFKAPASIPVFLGVGADEQGEVSSADMTADTQDLARRLNRHRSGLVVRFQEFKGEGHVTMRPDFFSRALRFALPPQKALPVQSASPTK